MKADLITECCTSSRDVRRVNALLDKAMSYQLCVNHAVRETGYQLWKAGLPKQERKEIRRRLRTILDTCRNSAVKHLKDGDAERLHWKIDKILKELEKLA